MADKGITRERLKELVFEEHQKLVEEGLIREFSSDAAQHIDHASIKEIVSGASGLLKAIEKFKSKASQTMQSSVQPSLGKLEQVLNDMVTTPGAYVMQPKKVRKKVSLRNVSKSAKD